MAFFTVMAPGCHGNPRKSQRLILQKGWISTTFFWWVSRESFDFQGILDYRFFFWASPMEPMDDMEGFVILQAERAQFLGATIIDLFPVLLTGPMFLRNMPFPRGETTI
jgi:hypothetical protein